MDSTSAATTTTTTNITATTAKSETKYERLRKIGIGSYGVVFKCVNRQTGQIVAIKRYSENDTDPIIRKIAMREVRMLRQLKHPNLIHLIEVFRRKRILHLVFDYCELTVLDVIEKYANNCPLNLIRKIIWQLVNGVSHCHAHNCIHRDIKPENILINQSGVVKLCDFGFARNLKSGFPASSSSSSCLKLANLNTGNAGQLGDKQSIKYEREAQLLGVSTNQLAQFMQSRGTTGSGGKRVAAAASDLLVDNNNDNNNKENYNEQSERQALTEYVATRWYRAPELLVGDVYYDKKIDIWAIGCVTAELMRGEPIWPGKTDLDQLHLIRNSLGPLTPSQTHTLLTQGLYDQANMERLLSQQTQVTGSGESLDRKLPGRVGQAGVEFVFDCLRIDPNKRPNCDELLQHHYIQSAQMTQFVRGSSHMAAATDKTRTGIPALEQVVGGGRRETRAIQTTASNRTNSQAILSIANNNNTGQLPITQSHNKRLVMAAADSSPPPTVTSSLSKSTTPRHSTGGSLVPIPVRTSRQSASTSTTSSGATQHQNQSVVAAVKPQQQQHYKRKIPPASGSAVQDKYGLARDGEVALKSSTQADTSTTANRRLGRGSQSNSSLVKSTMHSRGRRLDAEMPSDSALLLATPQRQRQPLGPNSRKPFDDHSTARRDRVQTNLGHHSQQHNNADESRGNQQLRTSQCSPAKLPSGGSSSSTSFLPSVRQNLR